MPPHVNCGCVHYQSISFEGWSKEKESSTCMVFLWDRQVQCTLRLYIETILDILLE